MSRSEIPRSLWKRLSALRGQLTRWIMVRGLGILLWTIVGLFLADMFIDRLFKMDFSQRLIMLVVMLAVVVAVAFWKLLKPISTLPGDDALIYEIEKGNQSLGESLISSIELSRAENLDSIGASPELTNATIERGIRESESIDFGNIIDRSGHQKNLFSLIAGVGLLILLGIGITQSSFLHTWFNRNIMLGDTQWPQGTYLEIVDAKDGKISLPRGINHRQLVNVTDASSVSNVSVKLELENADGSRTIYAMKPTGKREGRQHLFLFNNLSSEFRFRASGGDDVTDWVQVSLVEPPTIVDLEIKANLPAYTNASELILKGDGPHPVLAGSWLEINGKLNKPVTSATLDCAETTYPLSLSEDGLSFSATPGKSEELIAGQYAFNLVDEGNLRNVRKSKFTVTLKQDQNPKVRAELLGISGLVSARALLPTEYEVVDDFGLTDIQFSANWKTDETVGTETANESVSVLTIDSAANHPDQTWITTQNSEKPSISAFDLLPLKLSPGTSFRLSVIAHDNQPDAPGEGRSQEFLLRIVTDEALRADLLRREDEQRKAFEQAYETQLSLTTDLEAVSITQPRPDETAEDFHRRREMKLLELAQTQKGVGTAIDRIATRFEQFLVEITNNRLEEAEKRLAPGRSSLNERYDQKIIKPIREIDSQLISQTNRFLEACRRVESDNAKLQQSVGETIVVQNKILEKMKDILEAMNDSRSFQEFLNEILEIIDLEDRIGKGIEKENDQRSKTDGILEEAEPDDIFGK